MRPRARAPAHARAHHSRRQRHRRRCCCRRRSLLHFVPRAPRVARLFVSLLAPPSLDGKRARSRLVPLERPFSRIARWRQNSPARARARHETCRRGKASRRRARVRAARARASLPAQLANANKRRARAARARARACRACCRCQQLETRVARDQRADRLKHAVAASIQLAG